MGFRKASLHLTADVSSLPFYVAICLLLLTIVSSGVGACSFYCGQENDDYRICVSSIVGSIGADCSGLEGCFNSSTPCNEECPRTNPVLSDDKSHCSRCQIGYDGDQICPQCAEDTIWCKAEKTCKKRTEVCGGACNSVYFPILNDYRKLCESCPHPTKWCSAEQKCFDPQTGPCNKKCYGDSILDVRYCSKNNKCIGDDDPCGTQCPYNYRYCGDDRTCKYDSEPCSGMCLNGLRFCPLTGRCLEDSEACGELCPKGRKYCFVSDACIKDTAKCPCSNDRWGCSRFDETSKQYYTSCNILHNETLPETEADCWVTTHGGGWGSSHIDPGYCHPSSELCPGTMKTCVPKYVELSTCSNTATTETTTAMEPSNGEDKHVHLE